MWVGLGWTYVWVGLSWIFLTHHYKLGQKITFTRLDPTQPTHTPTQNSNFRISFFIVHQTPRTCSVSRPPLLLQLLDRSLQAQARWDLLGQQTKNFPSHSCAAKGVMLGWDSVYLKCMSHLLILFGFVLMVVWSLWSLLICHFFFFLIFFFFFQWAII